MKRIISIVFLAAINGLLLTAHSFSQTLSPKVIPASGGYFTAGGISLSWTMGEPFYKILQGGNIIVTQGEQQPYRKCSLTVSAGPNQHMLFGYTPEQCKTNTAIVTGGTAPFTYNWTLNRPLLTNVVNSSGDETMTGTNTASVTLCLLDTAILCVTVTDVNGCAATGCDTMFAEDVRCFTGNAGIQKVKMCHKQHQICVDSNAVQAHLNEGDYIGSCVNSSNIVGQLIAETNGGREFSIYPNPTHSEFIVSLNLPDDEMRTGVIRIVNASGQLVKRINVNAQSKINVSVNDPGIYIVQLSTNKQIINRKLTVLY